MSLTNKVALITGASSGIGRATALLFAREQAQVALVGRKREALQAVQDEIQKANGRSFIALADVSHEEQCQRVVHQTVEHFGGLDILVNAAGVFASGSLMATTPEKWNVMMNVNLNSVFYMMLPAVPHLQKRKGNIVNISSVTGTRSFPNVLAYCVSKAGVDQLTRCAALDLASSGVRVNAVNPGVVVTNLHRRSGMEETAYAAFLEHSKTTHPMGRVGTAEEIAEAVLFLASGRAGWITGVTLSVDGGRQLTCAR